MLRAVQWVAAAFGAIAATCGCEERRTFETAVYRVEGKMLVADRPAAGAKVTLHRVGTSGGSRPGGRGHYPRATVGDDGTFQFSTFVSQDGAPAGEYIVTVRWPDPEAVALDPLGEREDLPPDLLGGRFSSPQRSNLRATLPAEPSMLAPVDLSSRDVTSSPRYEIRAVPTSQNPTQ